MTTFLLVGLAMALFAVGCIVVPMLRRPRMSGVGRASSNVVILRGELAELDNDLARGTLDRAHYEEARAELERRVLDEARGGDAANARPARIQTWVAVIVAAAVPLAAGLLYVAIGNPDGLSPARAVEAAAGGQHSVTPQEIDAMLAKVVTRLEQNPNDTEGWVILARTYYATGRFKEAVPAYERATALEPGNAQLLVDYADSLAATQQTLAGKPMELVQRALTIEPGQWKARALAGTYAFDQKDYAGAVAHWERAKGSMAPESEMARSIDESIAQARALGNLPASAKAPAASAPVMARESATTAAPTAAPATAAAAEGGGIAGTVSLAPALVGKVAPTDTVFIFARPAQGPKMPLAILKKQVKDLPYDFVLDNSMAMQPGMGLANFAEVVVGARVSKAGQAIAQSGDLEGLSPTIKTGSKGVAIVIANVVP